MVAFTRDELKQILNEAAAKEVHENVPDLEEMFYNFSEGEADDPELIAETIANAAVEVASRLTSQPVFCFWQLVTPDAIPVVAGDMYLILYDGNGKLLTFQPQPPEPGVALFIENLDSVIDALEEIAHIVASNIQRGE